MADELPGDRNGWIKPQPNVARSTQSLQAAHGKPKGRVEKVEQKDGASPSCLHNVKDALALKFHAFLSFDLRSKLKSISKVAQKERKPVTVTKAVHLNLLFSLGTWHPAEKTSWVLNSLATKRCVGCSNLAFGIPWLS